MPLILVLLAGGGAVAYLALSKKSTAQSSGAGIKIPGTGITIPASSASSILAAAPTALGTGGSSDYTKPSTPSEADDDDETSGSDQDDV
jgi:hypothetical protein